MHSSPLTAVPRLPTTTQIASPLLLPFSLDKMSSSLTDSQSKWCPSFLNITFFLKLLTFLFGTVFFSTRISSLDFSVRFSQYEQFPQWLLVSHVHLFLTLFNKLEIIFYIMTFYPLVLLKVLMVLEIDNIIVLQI